MTTFAEPEVAWAGEDDLSRPLVVLLHGRGADEAGIIGLADDLPAGPSYAAVRAPIPEGGGHAWFANRGLGVTGRLPAPTPRASLGADPVPVPAARRVTPPRSGVHDGSEDAQSRFGSG